jgi:DNA mismatch repair protein MutH
MFLNTANLPPQSIEILKNRASKLENLELNSIINLSLLNNSRNKNSQNLKYQKGLIGTTIEKYLGASSQSLAQPDFPNLGETGIELKTIPILYKPNQFPTPKESTYVCVAPSQLKSHYQSWQTCWLRQKLSHVLWIPIQANPEIPLANRKILKPIFWELKNFPELEQQLKIDWEELIAAIQFGQLTDINAAYGVYLQLRPKASNNQLTERYLTHEGHWISIVPRGFYLRPKFTKFIFDN